MSPLKDKNLLWRTTVIDLFYNMKATWYLRMCQFEIVTVKSESEFMGKKDFWVERRGSIYDCGFDVMPAHG